jgi:hypothetical protein
MPVYGLQSSYSHAENGMTLDDMTASSVVADTLNEVIIFRSTGPWSQRWIERDYPTKNFHVKGKSSDWGPQAGFVPYLGKYSKVGGDTEIALAKAKQGTEYNDDGLKHQYTQKTQLCLTLEELNIQLTRISSGRTAITQMTQVQGSRDFFLYARRSTDEKVFAFRAAWSPQDGHYKIGVFDRLLGHQFETPNALEVMTSSEVGAHNKPLTGDYDLMCVCPTWSSYGGRTTESITKAGINFGRHGGTEQGQSFGAGVNLDGVLDMRTNTGLKGVINEKGKHQTYGSSGFTAAGYGSVVKASPGMSHEHDDMGNITPRILRCINYLNAKMGQSGPFRRVHHNAESHRNAIFGGITGEDMKKGEAFPLTVFQPRSLLFGTGVSHYQSVFTLEALDEFKAYAVLLHRAGFYVPRSWTWGMSIRDGVF